MKAYYFAIFLLWQCTYTYSKMQANNCCPDENLIVGYKCKDSSNDVTTADQKIKKVSLECEHGMFLIDPSIDPEETFTVDQNKRLIIGNESSTTSIDPGKYCISDRMEVTSDSNEKIKSEKVRVALVCFEDPTENTNISFTILPIMLIISVGCLALTFIVYIVVPELRDLQGWCTMCLCGSLTLGFLHLALAQTLDTYGANAKCYIIAFGMYFWLIAAFFWMNVISINMMKSVIFRNASIPDKRMFLYYNLYGWGVPLLLLLITLLANFKDGEHVKPKIGDPHCWFVGKLETWIYFYGPIAFLLATNIILFAITSQALWYTTSYENVTKLRSMKYKFCLYIKLFLITGISWIFELISFAVDVKNVAWMITDFFNALQGVIYLLILVVFRRRALKGLAALGLPIPYRSRNNDIEEECDEIIGEEHQPAMTIMP